MVILEFCERGNLHRMLSVESQYQTFTLEAKLKAVLDVATGMEAVASAGVVHCDLAARNVLVSHDFRFKVADFGMARSSNNIVWTPDPLFSGAEVVTFEFSATGLAERAVPIRWCAVEVIMEAKVSEASDVWSFGVSKDNAAGCFCIRSSSVLWLSGATVGDILARRHAVHRHDEL